METHNQTKTGTRGWLAIVAFVVAFDRFNEESLTHAAKRGMEHPVSRPFVAVAIGITALHLTNIIPEQYDPYYKWIDLNSITSPIE
jgi:hypothetical protein